MGIISRAEMLDLKNYRREIEERAVRQERAQEWERVVLLINQRKRDQSLLVATNNIITGRATDVELTFILSELHAWRQVLLKSDAKQSRYFIDNQSFLPIKIQETLQLLLPILKLKAFSFTDGLIQRSELINLLSLVQDAYVLNGSQSPQSNLLFIKKLASFIDKINNESLNEKQVLCLQRLVNDYQINLLGKHNLIEDILISHLMASITLSQLNANTGITQGLSINVDDFSVFREEFEQRIASLPLTQDIKKTIYEVILPGISTIIDDEQMIVDHVREHHGRLFYLNEKLPLHTDHASSTDPEEYRQTLRRLLIAFFGAAHIAYTKGHLNLFCEKICSGYCFEGRVRDTFTWVTSLSHALSFHETMEKYYQKEYVPYVEVMTNSSCNEADSILDFIMARHAKAACLHDTTYAPDGVVTLAGVKKYLVNILALVSERDCEKALQKIRKLRCSLEQQSPYFWSYPWKTLKQTKIDALTALEKSIVTDGESPDAAAKNIANQYPIALNGFYSRTKKLLGEIEQTGVVVCRNAQQSLK